jgi:small subunit ribosomal protein S16
MSVRIRLQRHGRKQTPVYHIVIADARAPRDGSFIERIGTYNPMTKPASIEVDRMKAYEWITKGAQPTDTVRAILRFKGVMYYKHLQRGVSKGAMTPEDAELKFRAWVDEKEAKIQARANATKEERKSRAEAISGKAKPAQQKKEDTPVEDELVNVNLAEQAAAETADDEVAVEVAAEEAPVAEEVTEAPAAEEVVAEEPKEEENKEEATPEG